MMRIARRARPLAAGRSTLLPGTVWLLCVNAAAAQEIRGRVIESEIDVPVAGAVVAAMDSALGVLASTITAADGRFAFDRLEPAMYVLQAELGGRFSSLSIPVAPASGADVVLVMPSLLSGLAAWCAQDGVAMAGLVYEDARGVPLPGVLVSVSWDAAAGPLSATTDRFGRYLFCAMPAGSRLSLRVDALGRSAHMELTLPDARFARADLAVDMGLGSSSLRVVATSPLDDAAELGELRGRILDTQTREPVPQVVLRIAGRREESASNADGTFRLAGLPDGEHVLEAQHLAYGTHREVVNVSRGVRTSVELGLTPQAIALAPIEVEGAVAARRAARMSTTRFDGVYGSEMAEAEARGARVVDVIRSHVPGINMMEGMFATRAGVQAGICMTSIRRLGSLRPSPGGSTSIPWCEPIPVYVNDVKVAEAVSFLRTLNLADYESFELMHATDAAIRFGMEAGAAGGALLLWTRGRGPYVSQARNVPPDGA